MTSKRPRRTTVQVTFKCVKCGISTRVSSSLSEGVSRMVGDADYVAQDSPIRCPTCNGPLSAEFDDHPSVPEIKATDDD